MDIRQLNSEVDFEFYYSRPAIVQLDITNNCQINCLYCYNHANEFLKIPMMGDDEILLIIRKIISQLNPILVCFSGGEPLLRYNVLKEAIDLLNQNDIYSSINTNALLLDECKAQELRNVGVRNIAVNIESMNPDIHDMLRGREGSLYEVLKRLEVMRKVLGGEKISIRTVITKLNYKDISDVAEYVKEKGFSAYHLIDLIPTNPYLKEIVLRGEEWKFFLKEYENILKFDINVKPNHAILFSDKFTYDIPLTFCMAGRLQMIICADGSIVPCNYFKSSEFVCGNALKDNLLEIWRNSFIMQKFRYSMEGYESCLNCEKNVACAGGCKAMSKVYGGNPFSPDPFCQG